MKRSGEHLQSQLNIDMKIYRRTTSGIFSIIDTPVSFPNPVVTVGSFDGVHVAHRTILQQVVDKAKQIEGTSVLITFDPHPREVLTNQPFELLQTNEEKMAKLMETGLDVLVIISFTKEFASLSAAEFIQSVVVDSLHAQVMIVGYNHNFGHDRQGGFVQLLQLGEQFGFSVEQMPALFVQEESVSSSKIRKALKNGDIQTANTYLGYCYEISGALKDGTLLLNGGVHKLLPCEGIYTVQVTMPDCSIFNVVDELEVLPNSLRLKHTTQQQSERCTVRFI